MKRKESGLYKNKWVGGWSRTGIKRFDDELPRRARVGCGERSRAL